MTQARAPRSTEAIAGIVDFDEALWASRTPAERAELLREAELLASVFAPSGRPRALRRMAEELSAGSRDGEMSRRHARRLAAALKHLAAGG